MSDKREIREKHDIHKREQSREVVTQEPSYGDDFDLTDIGTLRSLLYANNMRPNMSFGQKFFDRPPCAEPDCRGGGYCVGR